jgi:WS/DGAT/MGAT family acyltransferase
VNDVILAVVAGGLRELLVARGEIPPETLRVMIPVSIRSPAARGTLGNQVTAIFCHLPVGEADPRRRLSRISAETRGLKEGRQAIGALAMTRISEFMPPTLAAQAARLQASTRFFNLVVTNVPGPQHPLYLLGRRMLGSYPCVPLTEVATLGIALLSYDGKIGIGLLGDADRARDLPRLGEALGRALEELEGASAPRSSSPAPGSPIQPGMAPVPTTTASR